MSGCGRPDEGGVGAWEGEEGDGSAGEETLVGCYAARGGRVMGGCGGEFEGGDYATAVVVVATGLDAGEGADGAVWAVGTDEEASGYGVVGGKGDVWIGGEVEGCGFWG